MEKYSENVRDKRDVLEDIDEKISVKTAEIKRLSEEIDEIHHLRMKSEQMYGEVLEYWEGEEGFKQLYESKDEVSEIFRTLIQNREDAMKEAETEKKKLIREMEKTR